jgi:regulator of RNase E activity RraB
MDEQEKEENRLSDSIRNNLREIEQEYNRFEAELLAGIYYEIFNYFPELSKEYENVCAQINDITIHFSLEIWGTFHSILSKDRNYTDERLDEEARQLYTNYLSKTSSNQNTILDPDSIYALLNRLWHEQFHEQIHYAVKATLYGFYTNELEKLSGNALRLLHCYTLINSHQFLHNFYTLLNPQLEVSYPLPK